MSEYLLLDFFNCSSVFILSYPLLYISDKLMPTLGQFCSCEPSIFYTPAIQPRITYTQTFKK